MGRVYVLAAKDLEPLRSRLNLLASGCLRKVFLAVLLSNRKWRRLFIGGSWDRVGPLRFGVDCAPSSVASAATTSLQLFYFFLLIIFLYILSLPFCSFLEFYTAPRCSDKLSLSSIFRENDVSIKCLRERGSAVIARIKNADYCFSHQIKLFSSHWASGEGRSVHPWLTRGRLHLTDVAVHVSAVEHSIAGSENENMHCGIASTSDMCDESRVRFSSYELVDCNLIHAYEQNYDLTTPQS